MPAEGGISRGICWYTRRLELGEQWKSKCVYLHFEGAMQVAEVWLNGEKIATNHCGYLPFVVDLTRLARFGSEPNDLAVRLDNRDDARVPPGKPQKELDFCYFGGIYRNVRLEVVDRLHIADAILADKIAGGGVFATCSNVTAKTATVNVRTDLVNEHLEPRTCRIAQELCGPSGRIAAKSEVTRVIPIGGEATILQSLEVADPLLWHPNHPHLYTLRTTILGNDEPADVMTTRIGIRHIHFDRERGLEINGEKFVSLGANRHQDHPYVGYALPDNQHWRDVKKLREGGFTSFRSHYPQSPAFMDACDELGMLAIVSNPGWQFVGDQLFQQRALQCPAHGAARSQPAIGDSLGSCAERIGQSAAVQRILPGGSRGISGRSMLHGRRSRSGNRRLGRGLSAEQRLEAGLDSGMGRSGG